MKFIHPTPVFGLGIGVFPPLTPFHGGTAALADHARATVRGVVRVLGGATGPEHRFRFRHHIRVRRTA